MANGGGRNGAKWRGKKWRENCIEQIQHKACRGLGIKSLSRNAFTSPGLEVFNLLITWRVSTYPGVLPGQESPSNVRSSPSFGQKQRKPRSPPTGFGTNSICGRTSHRKSSPRDLAKSFSQAKAWKVRTPCRRNPCNVQQDPSNPASTIPEPTIDLRVAVTFYDREQS